MDEFPVSKGHIDDCPACKRASNPLYDELELNTAIENPTSPIASDYLVVPGATLREPSVSLHYFPFDAGQRELHP